MQTGCLPKGVIAPNLTPFNHDLSIAEDLYVAHANYLLNSGCAGLAPFGTTGEALSIGIDERIAVIQKMVQSGIDPDNLIPGTGLTNSADTARLSRACVQLGCKAVMTLPPFYYKGITNRGLYDYFVKLIDDINHPKLQIYLYHIPQVAGVGISVDVVRQLHHEFPDVIVGIKDSSGDWENTKALLEIKSLIVYPGSELPLIDALELGANGCISATANLNCADIASTINHYINSDVESAKTLHEQIKALRQLIQRHDLIAAQKRLLAITNGDSRWANLRPPLLPLSKADGLLLKQKIDCL